MDEKLKNIFCESTTSLPMPQEKIDRFMLFAKRRMRGVTFSSVEEGYSSTKFVFTISSENPELAAVYANRIFARNLNVVFDTEGVQVRFFGAKMYIEVPKAKTGTLSIYRGIQKLSEIKKTKNELLFYVGETDDGKSVIYDFADSNTNNFLIGGVPGGGKSVCIHDMLISMITRYTPEEFLFVVIDCEKRAGYGPYYGDPHEIRQVVLDREESSRCLDDVFKEIQNRNRIMTEAGYSEISNYNTEMPEEKRLPHLVVVIEEAQNYLAKGKPYALEIKNSVNSIASEGRSSGVHLVLAAQKAINIVLESILTSNLTGRIVFKTQTSRDSISFIKSSSAQHLVGKGDAYCLKISDNGTSVEQKRTQAAFVSEKEIKEVVKWSKEKYGHYKPQS